MGRKEDLDYKILREAQRLYGFQKRGKEYRAKCSARKLAALRAKRDNMKMKETAKKLAKEEEEKARKRMEREEEHYRKLDELLCQKGRRKGRRRR